MASHIPNRVSYRGSSYRLVSPPDIINYRGTVYRLAAQPKLKAPPAPPAPEPEAKEQPRQLSSKEKSKLRAQRPKGQKPLPPTPSALSGKPSPAKKKTTPTPLPIIKPPAGGLKKPVIEKDYAKPGDPITDIMREYVKEDPAFGKNIQQEIGKHLSRLTPTVQKAQKAFTALSSDKLNDLIYGISHLQKLLANMEAKAAEDPWYAINDLATETKAVMDMVEKEKEALAVHLEFLGGDFQALLKELPQVAQNTQSSIDQITKSINELI